MLRNRQKQKSFIKKSMKGFTLIELLVTLVIFTAVIIAVYAFFDQGRWLSLHAEKLTNSNDNARLVMEQLERDLRMIGGGVPSQNQAGSANTFLPYVFQAAPNRIFFRADIDSGNSMIELDVASGAGTIDVVNPAKVCPATGILVVKRGRIWDPYACDSSDASTISISPGALRAYEAAECEVFTPEHIFYRLKNDANNDGNCDLQYPYCELERAEIPGNTPIGSTADTNYTTIATNIKKLEFKYFSLGSSSPLPYTSGVLSTTNLGFVDEIVVVLTVEDRTSQVQKYKPVTMTSTILVRKVKA